MPDYAYKEYEEQIFRILLGASVIEHQVEIYRKGKGFVPFENATLVLMRGYDVSEKQAKQRIANQIIRR